MTNKTVKKLKPIAKRLVLKGYSKLTKAELIKLLEAHTHNESANKLRSLSKELGASHRSAIIKQIDSKRNSSNILDEPVPEINAPTLKPKRNNILDEPVPEINAPTLKPKQLNLVH